MNTLFSTLLRPAKTFNEIKTAGKFPTTSLIIVLFLMLLNLILMVPIMEKITSLTFSTMNIPENQRETISQVAYKMRYLQAFGSFIMYALTIFFYALLLYAIGALAKAKLKYKEALTLITLSTFVIVLGDLINTGILYIRSLDAITNPYEIVSTGINMLTSVDQVGPTLYTFLGYINPFQIAFIILLSVGLKMFTDIKYAKAFSIAFLLWIITILIPTMSVYFSQLTLAKSGIL